MCVYEMSDDTCALKPSCTNSVQLTASLGNASDVSRERSYTTSCNSVNYTSCVEPGVVQVNDFTVVQVLRISPVPNHIFDGEAEGSVGGAEREDVRRRVCMSPHLFPFSCLIFFTNYVRRDLFRFRCAVLFQWIACDHGITSAETTF